MNDPNPSAEAPSHNALARAWERRRRALDGLRAAAACSAENPTTENLELLEAAKQEDREADAAYTRLYHEAQRRRSLTPAEQAREPTHLVALTRGENEALRTAATDRALRLPRGDERANLRTAFTKLVESRKATHPHEGPQR